MAGQDSKPGPGPQCAYHPRAAKLSLKVVIYGSYDTLVADSKKQRDAVLKGLLESDTPGLKPQLSHFLRALGK